ncbi:MAG: hypothetical protein AAGU02_05395 [Lawsonibacter sp.]
MIQGLKALGKEHMSIKVNKHPVLILTTYEKAALLSEAWQGTDS